jgi:hypothetical protein
MNDSYPYRYTPYELELIKRLSFNVFKKSKHFDFDRYPEIFWVEGYSRTSSFNSDKEWHDTRPINEDANFEYDPNYNIDLLGCYLYNKEANHIELYGLRIRETAERISKRLGIPYELTMELLQAIVLIHEIGHWFSHACFIEIPLYRMDSFNAASKEIIETIAQLSVIWSTLGMKDQKTQELLKIMDYLTSKQPYPYRQYLKLSKDYNKKNRILNRYINILDEWDYDLDYLLLKTKTLIPSIRLISK